jgi:hypothetical protein
MRISTFLFPLLALVLLLALKFYPIDVSTTSGAAWWKAKDLGVKCAICAYECFLPDGFVGKCNQRINRDGRLHILYTILNLSPSKPELRG